MDNKGRLSLISFVVFSVLYLFLTTAYAAKSRTIDYMPRDQELDMVHQSLAITVGEVNCANGMQDAMRKFNLCDHCMDLKDRCPDCCINTADAADRKTACQDFLDDYTAHPMVFEPETCSPLNDCLEDDDYPVPDVATNYGDYANYCSGSTIPGCQRLGCPTGEPDPGGGGHGHGAGTVDSCEGEVDSIGNLTGNYICSSNSLSDLLNPGCPINAGSGVSDCNSVATKYVTSNLPASDCPAGVGHPCWKYQPTTTLANCISACQSSADDNETAAKGLDCCRKDSGVCADPASPSTGLYGDRPGYSNNCTNTSACQERADWEQCQDGAAEPELCCDILTSANCDQFAATAGALVDGMVSGSSTDCFSDISNSFIYDFVAKSNERIMMIWQVQASPEYLYCGSSSDCTPAQEAAAVGMADLPGGGIEPSTYFYTTVKIFDITNGTEVEVYPGTTSDAVVNQRSFTNAFTIYAAAATNMTGTPPTSILTQGHRYRIRLYYLLAPLPNYVLRSKISDLQLVIMRVRE